MAGVVDFSDQRLALPGEFLRRVGEFGPFAGCRLGALRDGGDLCRSVVIALVPALPLFGDGLQPAIGEFGLARDALRLDPHFGKQAAILGDDLVDVGELGFEVGGRGQRG